MLPSSLIVTNQSCKGAEEREKTVIVSDNSAVVEFLIEDISEDTSKIHQCFDSQLKHFLQALQISQSVV